METSASSTLPRATNNVFNTLVQGTLSGIIKVKKYSDNTDVLQKVCQVFFAVIQLAILFYPPAGYLSRFAICLAAANMHDFFAFLKLPRTFFLPVTARTINANALLKQIVNSIKMQDGLGAEWNSFLEKHVKDCLNKTLTEMDEKGIAFSNEKEFATVVRNRIVTIPDKYNKGANANFKFSRYNLNDLKVQTRHVPLFEKITNLNFAVVDISCVGLYLQTWNLLNTAKWAAKLGQVSVLRWVTRITLETWVVGTVASAFAFKLIESIRRLRDDHLTKQEKTQVSWAVVTSAAEEILHSSNFMNLMGYAKINKVYLYCFAIVAKSLGVAGIVHQVEAEPYDFFQKPTK